MQGVLFSVFRFFQVWSLSQIMLTCDVGIRNKRVEDELNESERASEAAAFYTRGRRGPRSEVSCPSQLLAGSKSTMKI